MFYTNPGHLASDTFDSNTIVFIHKNLKEWNQNNAKHFPWREDVTPFKILVAEKLLQQTAARDYVVEIFRELISKYPDPATLARADLEFLKDILSPLGLFRRAEELIAISLKLESEYLGTVPSELENLKGLPGVGEYTARAVLCFGYDCDIAIVDTNIARWLFRIIGIEKEYPQNPARDRNLTSIAQVLVPRGEAKSYNWALLDFCSLTCTARNPKCHECPLINICAFGKNLFQKNESE